MATSMTPTEQDKELRGIVGEIPNYIFECLELSDEIKEEWKYGSKASDFGSHNQFVHKYEKKLADFIIADRKRVALEARIETVTYIESMLRFENIPLHPVQAESLKQYLRQLKAQQEEV